jgi:hypothetical protein
MKRWNIAITAAALMLLASVTLHAQGKGGGSANKPPKQNTSQSVKPQTTKSSPTTQAKAPKTSQTTKTAQGPKTQTANAHPTKTQSTKTQPAKTAQNTKPSTKGSKASTATNASNTTTTGTTSGTGTSNTEPNSSTPSPTNHVVLTPVQQKLTKNTNLAGKLQSRLPPGTDLMKAADGFRNLGQFVAAVNVSNNLDIPFRQLKTEMVKENLSLGQAIQKLKPTASGTVEAQRAEYDAQGMIYQSEQQNTTTTTTTTSSKKSNKNSAGGGSDE